MVSISCLFSHAWNYHYDPADVFFYRTCKRCNKKQVFFLGAYTDVTDSVQEIIDATNIVATVISGK